MRPQRPRLGGVWHLLTWLTFVIAIILFVLERAASLSATSSGLAYLGGAWRHLLLIAFCLWLFHACLVGQMLLLAPQFRLGGERLISLLAILLLIGGGLVAIALVLTWQSLAEAQVSMLRKLFWGALPEALAIAAAGGLLLRTTAARKLSHP